MIHFRRNSSLHELLKTQKRKAETPLVLKYLDEFKIYRLGNLPTYIALCTINAKCTVIVIIYAVSP